MYFEKNNFITITLIHIFYAISLSQNITLVKILLANQVTKYLKCKTNCYRIDLLALLS